MSSTLTNSLLLLNEIRDHLKKSKGSLHNDTSPRKKFEKTNTTFRSNHLDSEVNFTSITTEEEPLRVQLSRRVEQSFKNSPPVSQKIKIEDDEEALLTEGSYSRVTKKLNNSISPNKRKQGKLREHEDFSLEKFSRKSHQLADNLKRLINEEIENFSNECDNLRQKLQNMLDEKPSRGAYNENTGVTKPQKSGEYLSREETSESKLNQITQKIEKLMEDIDERKVGMSSSLKDQPATFDYDTFGGNPSPFRSRKSVQNGDTNTKH